MFVNYIGHVIVDCRDSVINAGPAGGHFFLPSGKGGKVQGAANGPSGIWPKGRQSGWWREMEVVEGWAVVDWKVGAG